jgi:hypothetical protein
MEEGDILNSIEDFADYGSGKTILIGQFNSFIRIPKIKFVLTKLSR